MKPQPLLLASSSPRRRDLLTAAGVPIEVCPPRDVDETARLNEPPEALVRRLAAEKAQAVAAIHPGRLVLGADTIVYHDGEVLGKPADLAEAAELLRRLSGHVHQVYTGVCLVRLTPQLDEQWVSVSEVTFRLLDEGAITAAMQLTNPLDKAGGYAIQEQEAILVERTSGWRSTIIGLPVEEVVKRLHALQAAGQIEPILS